MGFLLIDSLGGLSEEEIDRGEDLPPAQMEEALKKAVNQPEKVDSALVQAALSLPVQERDKLAAKLLHSLDEDIPGEVVTGEEWEEAWRVELERRVKEIGSGAVKLIPWEEVEKELRELLGEG